MKGLKRLFKRFESIMTAVTFAEEGEFESAREFLREDKQLQKKAVKRPERAVRRA